MKAYKGFNKDMTCRGFQFKEGETYETEEAKLCECGFHACEAPIDVFNYYSPESSEYHEVNLEDVSDERNIDTKVCAKKIKIGAKLSIEKLIELQIEYTKAHCTNEHHVEYRESVVVGDYSATNSGICGAVTAGDYSTVTVDSWSAATVGEDSVAIAGDRCAVTVGPYSVATAGAYGAATAGRCGAATVGAYGVGNVRDNGLATAGNHGVAVSEYDSVVKAGKFGVVVSKSHSSVDKNGLAFARGNDVKVKGELGAIIFIVEEQGLTYDILEWKAGVIDGKTLKPNVWYKLKNGEFVECE